MPKKILVSVGILVALAVSATAWWFSGSGLRVDRGHESPTKSQTTASPRPSDPALPLSATEPMRVSSGVVSGTVDAVSARPVPPAKMAAWYSWTEPQRMDFVTDAQHDAHLPAETLAFFRAALFDRQLAVVTRNNMASALIGQEVHDPTLASTFRRIVEDPTEDVKWRDYSLQFMATCIDWSDNPNAMADAIWKQAQEGPGTVSGTAMLHLHYIDERGVRPLPRGYGDRLAKCLTDQSIDLPTRMTAVGIVGQRMMIDQTGAIRGIALNATEPAMRRTALATLGVLGDPVDLELVRKYTADPDPLIAAAAKGAERNLSGNANSVPPAKL